MYKNYSPTKLKDYQLEIRKKLRKDLLPRNRLLKNQLFTRHIDEGVIAMLSDSVEACSSTFGFVSNIKTTIDYTFGKYQFSGMDHKYNGMVGICTGLFFLNPYFMTKDEVKKNNFVKSEFFKKLDNYVGFELGYMCVNDNCTPVFPVEEKKLKYVNYQYGGDKNYYCFETNVTKYWFSKDFSKKPFQVYIFLCSTANYMSTIDYDTNTEDNGHIWLTSVFVDKTKRSANAPFTITTNIFDTNSTNIFNIQYARMISIIIQRDKRFNTYIPIVDPRYTEVVYYMNCQNKYYSDADEDEPCIGLQDREVWGLCQSFIIVMYLILVHNPILAHDNLDEVIRRPGIDRIFYTVHGLVTSAEKIYNDVQYTDNPREDKYVRYEYGTSRGLRYSSKKKIKRDGCSKYRRSVYSVRKRGSKSNRRFYRG